MYYKRKVTGGVRISSTCKLESISEAAVAQILHEYRIHSAEVLFREDCTIEQFIDMVEGNRKYVRCLYVYHKIDMTSMEEVRRIAAQPDCMVLSCQAKLNLDVFLDRVAIATVTTAICRRHHHHHRSQPTRRRRSHLFYTAGVGIPWTRARVHQAARQEAVVR